MMLQRVLGLALLALSSATLGYTSGAWTLPIFAAAAGALGFFAPLGLTLPTRRRIIGALLLGVVFALKVRLMPSGARDTVILNGGLGFALSQYFLVLQASLFFVRRSVGRGAELVRERSLEPLSSTLAAFAVASTGFAGDIYARGSQVRAYEALALLVVLLVAGFLAATPRPRAIAHHQARRYVLSALTLLGAVLLATGVSQALVQYRYDLDRIVIAPFAQLFGKSGVGFSASGQLGSVAAQKGIKADTVALRVKADIQPGYLRGMAFSDYENARWDMVAGEREAMRVAPPAGLKPLNKDETLFRLRKGSAKVWHGLEVWPAQSMRAMFSPLSVQYLGAKSERIKIDVEGIPLSNGSSRYSAYVSEDASPSALPDPARYTAVPSGLDPRISDLADRIFAGCDDVMSKTQAVEDYFRQNYHYKLGITIPMGKDPLTYFLLERPDAHCEYFASGAAILLRLAGVPCRYVTGFVASERNATGGYWVARNRDAHAWVEAYDGATWITVEATPGDGVPDAEKTAGVAEWWDALKFRLRELVVAALQDGLRGVARWVGDQLLGLLHLLLTLPGALIVGVTFAAIVVLRRRRRPRPRRVVPDPTVRALHALLARADRQAAKAGYMRGPGETLHAFARRLDKAATEVSPALHALSAWYVMYADLRYRGDDPSTALAELRMRIPS